VRRLIVLAAMLAGCSGGADEARVVHNSVTDESAQANSAAPEMEPRAVAAKPASACLVQEGKVVPPNELHAIGTEPFWAVEVEGRCVTYSTPEDQKGTRVWTRFEGTATTGTWTGALEGQEFVMATTPQDGCSDGMSDKSYPIAVTLTAKGEQRRGCAEQRWTR